MATLSVVSVLFLLSLLGAFILFKFLESSAIVTSKQYKAGGAIGGFIIIYGILYSSYYGIESRGYEELQGTLHQLETEHAELTEKHQQSMISGVIKPSFSESGNTEVVLAIQQTNPDAQGRFNLKARCINPEEDDVRVYVIKTDLEYPMFLSILSEDEMTNIMVPFGG